MNLSERWPRGLYLITPDDADTGRLLERVGCAIAAGPTWLQYRNKSASPTLRREQASALLPLCRRHEVPLIVNDDWRLAFEIGADGAHLGELDGDLAKARAAMGPAAILGASCYDQPQRAFAAADAGAGYVAFGAFFPSGTKPGARRASLDLLRPDAASALPRVAIGGITPDNARLVIDAGADLVAVVGGVFDRDDPAAAVRDYLRCFQPLTPENRPA